MMKLIFLASCLIFVANARAVENQLDEKFNAEDTLDDIFEDLKEVQEDFKNIKKRGEEDSNENTVDQNYGKKTDIMPNPEEKNADGSYKRTFQGNARYYWVPDNNGLLEIPFRFKEDDYDTEEKESLLESIATMNGHLKGCHDNAWVPAAERHEGKVIIEFGKRGGCWSYIGKVAHIFTGQFPNKIQPMSIDRGCFSTGIVNHEMMHAMGFHHEQSRPDRDDYVTINFANIREGFEGNFEKASSVVPGYAIRSTYDYSSVMHYGRNDFTNNGQRVITTKDPAFQNTIGQRSGLSPKDVEELRMLFKCSDTATTQKPTTTEASSTQKPTTTEARTTQKQTTTEARTTEGESTTEARTTQKPTTTEARTTEGESTTEARTTQKPTTTEARTTQKPTTTEARTTQKQTTTEARTTEGEYTTGASTTEGESTTGASTTEGESTTEQRETTEAITTEAVTTTEYQKPVETLVDCNFTKRCVSTAKGARFLSRNFRYRSELSSSKTNCSDSIEVCATLPATLCEVQSPFKWIMRRSCQNTCDNCPHNSNQYLQSRNRRNSYFKIPLSRPDISCEEGKKIKLSASFDLMASAALKYGSNHLSVLFISYARESRRWKKLEHVHFNAIDSNTPINEWHKVEFKGEVKCGTFYYVYAVTARKQRSIIKIDNLVAKIYL